MVADLHVFFFNGGHQLPSTVGKHINSRPEPKGHGRWCTTHVINILLFLFYLS